MFARRIFELLACNTVAVSNYARSIRLMFGDLVLSSDDPAWTVRRLRQLSRDPNDLQRFRLAALRKVLREHTYADRLRHVWAKVTGDASKTSLPSILVVSHCNE